jgi:hypothetical protein
MKTLHFSTVINAPRKIVWDTMLNDRTYRIWTAAFAEGCYYKGSWEQGERIQFLAPSGDGMVSVIAENRLHQFLSIKHLGVIAKGVEDTQSEEVQRWAPAYENYTFTDVGSATDITVTMDVAEDWESYMIKAWPKALASLKALSESAKE